MKLNLDFYQEKEETLSKAQEELIKEYIEKYDDSDYEKYFKDTVSESEIYHLSSESQNMVNWYPFQEESTILEIGGNLGELTEVFCRKAKRVVTIEPNFKKAKAIEKRHKKQVNLEIIVGNLKEIELNEKFDYITLIGCVDDIYNILGENGKLENLLETLKDVLAENGKLLLAVDNKFGLRYFAGNPENKLNKKFESLIGYNNELEKIETFTYSSLKRNIEKLGLFSNFYYPLPDYRMPNVIFSDKQLPKYNTVDKYNPYYKEKSTILINEIDVLREILKTDENMFRFFANSFFVEITKNEFDIKYQYISYNNLRKEGYRLITKISDNYVEKDIVNDEANNHYNEIKENIYLLQKSKIKTVDYIENEKIYSRYINQENMLNNVLTQALEEKREDDFERIMNKYIEIISNESIKINNYQNTVFAKYKIEVTEKEKNLIKEMNFLKEGLWDMTFKNSFYIDGDLYFFDQEWKEENLPVEYILYRSILYTISLRRYINIDNLLERYGLNIFRELFTKLDNKLQEKIRDDKIWEFYSQNKFFDIDGTKQELINLGIRDNAKQLAIENLEKEREREKQEKINLIEEKEKLIRENQLLKRELELKFSKRIFRKIKKILGGKYE